MPRVSASHRTTVEQASDRGGMTRLQCADGVHRRSAWRVYADSAARLLASSGPS